jgi:outer membrane lipoprotein SlyB
MKKSIFLFALLISVLVGASMTGCKAWRTISTTATYVQQNDTAKSTATITTKTVEEYQGVKKK